MAPALPPGQPASCPRPAAGSLRDQAADEVPASAFSPSGSASRPWPGPRSRPCGSAPPISAASVPAAARGRGRRARNSSSAMQQPEHVAGPAVDRAEDRQSEPASRRRRGGPARASARLAISPRDGPERERQLVADARGRDRRSSWSSRARTSGADSKCSASRRACSRTRASASCERRAGPWRRPAPSGHPGRTGRASGPGGISTSAGQLLRAAPPPTRSCRW